MYKKINPYNLFRKEIMDYQVDTVRHGMTRYVNFDNAATTPALLEVEKSVQAYMKSYGSVHRGAGTKSTVSTDVYEESRDVIKEYVNAPEDAYVIFTGNTTGAMNTLAHFFSFLPGKVAVSTIEHSSSWLPWIQAEGIKHAGKHRTPLDEMDVVTAQIQTDGQKQIVYYDVNDEFEFDLADVEHVLKENKVKALVLTGASNLTGYHPNIAGIGALTKKYGTYLVVDACQLIQHDTIDMKKMHIDFLAASGHKMYAPYGGGFLIGPKEFLDKFLPYQIGGGNITYIEPDGTFHREKDNLTHDPGTPNALGAITMAQALKSLKEIGVEHIQQYEHVLASRIFSYLEHNPKVKLYTSKKNLSTIITFTINGRNPDDISRILNDEYGIGTRSGNFCMYQAIRKLQGKEDHPPQQILSGVIRVSIALCNTMEDVKRFVRAMEEITRV